MRINIEVGDIIEFGVYPQKAEGAKRRSGIIKISLDGQTEDDKNNKPHANAFVLNQKNGSIKVFEEDYLPIKWRVLQKDDESLFLISETSLDYLPFHNSGDDAMHFHDWDNSTLREWLNTQFFEIAFSKEEQAQILPTLCADNTLRKAKPFDVKEWQSNADRWYGERQRTEDELKKIADRHNKRYEVSDTLDKVFLLSVKEADELLGKADMDKSAQLTDFGIKRAGEITSQMDDEGKFGFPWWLRTVFSGSDVSYAMRYGVRGEYYSRARAVRPSIRLSLKETKNDEYSFKVHNPSRNFEKEAQGFKLYKKAKQMLMCGEGSDADACELLKQSYLYGYKQAFYAIQTIFQLQQAEQETGEKIWKASRSFVFDGGSQEAKIWSGKDFEFAHWWYRKKAEAGDVDAMYCLGHMFYNPFVRGDYMYFSPTPKTDEEYEGTFFWLGKAAQAGMFEAQALLGEIFEGDCARADQKQAFFWLSKAAVDEKGAPSTGHDCGRIQCKLAYMCLEGRGTKKDKAKAFFWADKASVLNGYRKADYIYFDLLEKKALDFAKKAHQGQTDKNGVPYINHVKKVASFCRGAEAKTVALLHDVVEDTKTTLDDLRQNGFPEEVVEAVDCMTKRKGESLEEYLTRVASNEYATEVKFADMRHNSDKKRWSADKQEQAEANFKKYHDCAKQLATLLDCEAEYFMTAATARWFNKKQFGDKND